MAGLVPAIHVLLQGQQVVDHRDSTLRAGPVMTSEGRGIRIEH